MTVPVRAAWHGPPPGVEVALTALAAIAGNAALAHGPDLPTVEGRRAGAAPSANAVTGYHEGVDWYRFFWRCTWRLVVEFFLGGLESADATRALPTTAQSGLHFGVETKCELFL